MPGWWPRDPDCHITYNYRSRGRRISVEEFKDRYRVDIRPGVGRFVVMKRAYAKKN